MRFDPVIVDSRILVIEANLRRLEALQSLSFNDFANDFRNVEAAKHLLQVAIEAMIDIAAHFVARLRLKVPDNSARLFAALREAGLLPPDHAARYSQMARFRNLIVHLYSEVEAQEVYAIIQNDLGDFRTFIADARRIVGMASTGRSGAPDHRP